MMQPQAISKVQQFQEAYIAQELPQPILIQINPTQLSPLNPDIFMLTTTQQFNITHPSLISLYCEKKLQHWFFHPYTSILTSNKQLKILLQDLGLPTIKQFADQQRGPNAERWLRHWIVQLGFLGLLHINGIKNVDQILLNPQIAENWVFPQLNLSNIFVKEFWGKKVCIIDQSEVEIQNPLIIRLTNVVANLNQYLKNLSKILDSLIFFDELVVKQFLSLRDLQKFYFHEIKNHEGKQFSTKFMESAIKYQFDANEKVKGKQQPHASLSAEEIKWIHLSAGISKSLSPKLICKASESGYSPSQFWNQITEQKKGLQKGKCLIVLTSTQQNKKDAIFRIAFYSSQFPNRQTCLKHPLGFYQKDNKKNSVLLNLTKKTVHQLDDSEYAFGYNPNLLLTIGKCDIVLSAFNITNLCYFPVSFGVDGEGLCQNEEQLCGGRNFRILELQLYKFVKN